MSVYENADLFGRRPLGAPTSGSWGLFSRTGYMLITRVWGVVYAPSGATKWQQKSIVHRWPGIIEVARVFSSYLYEPVAVVLGGTSLAENARIYTLAPNGLNLLGAPPTPDDHQGRCWQTTKAVISTTGPS